MTYQLYAVKSNPIALFTLDQAPAYTDYSGNGSVGNTAPSNSAPATAAALCAGLKWSTVFANGSKARFTTNVFMPGTERKPFALEAWVYPIQRTAGDSSPQQILSHSGAYDGLTINGSVVSFTTQYTTAADSVVSYDLGVLRAAHIVAVHSRTANMLYVDSDLVATTLLTTDQISDTYEAVTNAGYLYVGGSTSTQAVAINGLAIYSTISYDRIKANYVAGRRIVGRDTTYPLYDGTTIEPNSRFANVSFESVYASAQAWAQGYQENVEVSSILRPTFDPTATTSEAGYWYTSINFESFIASPVGISAEWYGQGVTVQTSPDRTTWTSITNGGWKALVSNPGLLHVRVGFAGGVVNDPAYLSSLTLRGFVDNTVRAGSGRAVTFSAGSVPRSKYEPVTYREDNGMRLNSTTLTVGASPDATEPAMRVLEVWIKPISGTPTISVTGTKYRNGAADSTMPVGEWSLIHIVSSTDIAGFTINGNAVVGPITLYPTLAASDIAYTYSSYTGYPVLLVNDSGAVGASEPAVPVSIYSHAWSVDQVS